MRGHNVREVPTSAFWSRTMFAAEFDAFRGGGGGYLVDLVMLLLLVFVQAANLSF